MRSVCVALGLVLVLCSTSWAWEDDRPVGYVQFVQADAYAASQAGWRKLELMSEIHEGDILATGPDAKLQVILHDGGYLILGQESLARVEAFAHEWGVKDPEENYMNLDLGPGACRVVAGRIQEKNEEGVHLATALGALDLATQQADLRTETTDGASFAQTLSQALAQSDPQSLATLLDQATQDNALRLLVANNGTGERETLRFTGTDGTLTKIKPGMCLGLSESTSPKTAPDTENQWDELKLETDVFIPSEYKLMLGEDWGGAKGGDGNSDPVGCGC